MILRRGTTGERVRELQALLKLKADGIFGPATEAAVKAFQKSKGLKADGMIGPQTWAVLSAKTTPVKPLFDPKSSVKEDDSDPEDAMPVENVVETSPTSKRIEELTSLIINFKYKRKVTKIIFHCTATQPNATVSAILRYWKEKLGWKSPGYHIIVTADGSWTQLQDFNLPTNGVKGHNANSIHVSYIGGIDKNGRAKDTRTQGQHEIFEACHRLFAKALPTATHHGHYEFTNKACPSFNVKQWIKSLPKL
jgi:N-acetylmuramoyl-L-alanine amidase